MEKEVFVLNVLEAERQKQFVFDRLGKRCVWCGNVIYTQSELSFDWCDPCCVGCANRFGSTIE